MSYLVLARRGEPWARAAAGSRLPRRRRAAAVEGAAALHGLRAGGLHGARPPGEGRRPPEPRASSACCAAMIDADDE